jgi:eukaryotic-like serine/threonine-protein kinase
MNPDSWRPIEELYSAVCDLPSAERNELLARADPQVRAIVEAMLATEESALDRPAWEGILAETGTSPLGIDDAAITVLAPGTLIGRYRIEASLGEGGMGQVFRAHDTRLGRTVALKLVRSNFIRRKDFRSHLEREAQAISALNHPNICALYDVGEQDGVPFLVMEYVEGETLAALLKKGRPPAVDSLRYGIQIASALAAAHAKHIIHRDLKPVNIIITPAGLKVLDFGIAKNLASGADGAPLVTGTEPGQIVGTPAYMSPEQISGTLVDSRSDIFSLGAVLYEMLCGRHPFQGRSAVITLGAVLHKAPDRPRSLQPDIPAPLERIVMRCLEKEPAARFASADEVHGALSVLLSPRAVNILKPRIVAIAAALLVLAGAVGFAIHQRIRGSRIRWVEKEAVPRITRLIGEDRRLEALDLYRQAQDYDPSSPALPALAEGVTARPVSFKSTPPGAKIYISDYTADAGDDLAQWRPLGSTPLKTGQIPRWGYYRIRAEKEGFAPLFQTFFPVARLSVELTLQPASTAPAGMVWVPAELTVSPAPPLPPPGYWMDAYEVSNREFKKFVDAGGYQKPEYWKQPFLKDGKPLSWQQAMEEFRDSTRRPGPAGWQLGTYPDGASAMPVGGVSWYEAAAYAEFAAKSLPTLDEWCWAAGYGAPNADILKMSNFSGKGPRETGTHRGMAPFGAYDMAGNLSEWTFTADAGGLHYVLGAAWDEQPYRFGGISTKEPLARAATIGFRCIRRTIPPPPESLLPLTLHHLDRGKPVDDTTYRIFARLQAYDKTPLDAKVQEVDDSSSYWRRETITFPAAYGGERMMLHLFLPRNATSPYQVVAIFGGSNIFYTNRVQDFQFPFEFLLRAGRAVVFPVFSGTLERGPSPIQLPVNQERERALRWPKDMGQTIDYLETRPDLDAKNLGFYGLSSGAVDGIRLIALDNRFKAAALVSGGLSPTFRASEIEAWNYAPRVRTPVLMLNGRDDLGFPVETAQKPLFKALGTPASDKLYVQYEGGHANLVSRPELIGQILEWFDHYLGPVKTRP